MVSSPGQSTFSPGQSIPDMGTVKSADSDADYTNEALTEFFKGTDAKIADPDLVNKKQLIAKQNPLSLVNQIISKWKRYGSSINLNECWETKDPKTSR